MELFVGWGFFCWEGLVKQVRRRQSRCKRVCASALGEGLRKRLRIKRVWAYSRVFRHILENCLRPKRLGSGGSNESF